jgi:hypothetical protein
MLIRSFDGLYHICLSLQYIVVMAVVGSLFHASNGNFGIFYQARAMKDLQ